MFDLGAFELLLIVIVAVIVIGPKDLPLAMRTAGRWAGKVRRVSSQFRSGVDTMIREAEMEEMEKTWKDRNAAIMKEHPAPDPDEMQAPTASPDTTSAESAVPDTRSEKSADPQLPLPPP